MYLRRTIILHYECTYDIQEYYIKNVLTTCKNITLLMYLRYTGILHYECSFLQYMFYEYNFDR